MFDHHQYLNKTIQDSKNPAMYAYLLKSNKGDKLPRGKYFKNKIAGHRDHLLIIDPGYMTHDFIKPDKKVA
jgi:hypothetical protein